MMHCSGDHATDIGLNAYDKVIKSGRPRTIMRIEHFGMFQLTKAQLARAKEMRKQGLYISVQPTWLLDLVKADLENMGEPRSAYRFSIPRHDRRRAGAGRGHRCHRDLSGQYQPVSGHLRRPSRASRTPASLSRARPSRSPRPSRCGRSGPPSRWARPTSRAP